MMVSPHADGEASYGKVAKTRQTILLDVFKIQEHPFLC